jgi:hypothetical protein
MLKEGDIQSGVGSSGAHFVPRGSRAWQKRDSTSQGTKGREKGVVKIASAPGIRNNSPAGRGRVNRSLSPTHAVVLQKDIRSYLGFRRLQAQR